MKKKGSKLRKSLYQLISICLAPLIVMLVVFFLIMTQFVSSYDAIVDDITKVNSYNLDFKETMDSTMYSVVVNTDRAGDETDPHKFIYNARNDFVQLFEKNVDEKSKGQLDRIVRSLDTLEDRVTEIEKRARYPGNYDDNLQSLDNNIRVITQLIQEQIQEYLSHQTSNLDVLRVGLKNNLTTSVVIFTIALVLILIIALFRSWKITGQIIGPVKELCDAAGSVGTGDFAVRAQADASDELAILSTSFNEMVERIETLVEDAKMEQIKLRAIELQLLQEQINPHFLYNTLDTIVWLAETGENEQVILMVNALSDFFRTGLSNGHDIVSVKDEGKHVESYLKIQQFRYQDIMRYTVDITPELSECRIPKLTLQPLVENALYHGIKNKRGKGTINVLGRRIGEFMVLTVKDDGIGMDAETLRSLHMLLEGQERNTEDGHGFGLKNVLQRIQLTYGNDYGIEINSQLGQGTEVKVILPVDSCKIS